MIAMAREPNTRRGEISRAVADGFRKLLASLPPARRERVAEEVRALERLFDQLASLGADSGAGACWRCGASLAPTEPDVEAEISRCERSAAWAGWPSETYRCRMRAELRPGDRVIGVRFGAVTVRRADGAILEVARTDG